MRTALLIIIALVATTINVGAQNTTRKGLKVKPVEVKEQADSSALATEAIVLSGYEKEQKQTKETVFVTNKGTNTVNKINVTITYIDKDGKLLHRRTETLKCYLPAGETRMVSFRSWDPQRMWYYKKATGKHTDNARPYDVDMRVNYVVY